MFSRKAVIVDGNFTCGNREYLPFSRVLDLDPMTFVYENGPYSFEVNFVRQVFLKLSSDRQTDRQTDTTEII